MLENPKRYSRYPSRQSSLHGWADKNEHLVRKTFACGNGLYVREINSDGELHYLVEGVLKKQGEKLYNWKLRTGLNPPQMNTDKQAQEIGEFLQVTGGETDQQRCDSGNVSAEQVNVRWSLLLLVQLLQAALDCVSVVLPRHPLQEEEGLLEHAQQVLLKIHRHAVLRHELVDARHGEDAEPCPVHLAVPALLLVLPAAV